MNRKTCPFHNEPCHGDDCALFTSVRGEDPNTGVEIDEKRCAISFLPMLLIETAKAQYQTGAAVESTRNIFASALKNTGGIEDQS